MKRWIAVILMVLIPAAQAGKAAKVTLIVDDVPVVQVLQALAEQERQNLVVSPDVSGTLSLHLTEVPWKQALQTVVSSAGLVLRQEGTILYVHSQAWQNENRARQDSERLRRQANLPLENRSIGLQYADAAELAKAGEKLLSAKGTIMVDKRTNRLLLRDNRAVLAEMEKWVAQMDLPVAQVELAAHIVTINEKSLRELGVKCSETLRERERDSQRLSLAPQAGAVGDVTTLSSDLSVAAATSRVGFNIGRINGRLLDLELSALEQKQQLDIIASPRLLASHLQPASIKQGSEIPYQVSSGESGATSVEFKEAVLGMEVTPTVLSKGRIRLKLRISQNVPGQVLQQADGEVLAIDKQEIETQVEVKSGETLALGGIFSRKNKSGSDSVPMLGDIPWLGQLFRHDGKEDERRELVVFITPRLVATE
ncbi:DNA uptake porin HofQ [Salmonella bongori]|uniref:DNA uptake porin HofQ n=1 Tax=Salmonella bongori TaxID=54736 RepID=UPI00049B2DA0|nr:DNA uptake porin HofQ [Salmonella bongori]AID26155.1 outer membrane porin HofQ [Salmonella bongori serovar 48:z41:-- str. RKS3044]